MKTINKPGDNLGGGLKLYAVPPSLVTSIIAGVLTLSDTADAIEIYFTPGTLNIELENIPSSQSKAGGYHTHKISAFVPKIAQDVETELENMRNHKFVVVVMDGNEQFWAHGTATTPLRFSYSSATGGDTNDRNGYTFSFEGKTIDPPMIVSDPF
ncbi:MAG TPA: hypothetical protein PLB87_07770 [Prolixibacteraceae bacterium]|nr:hypothetical protein [Prolixibacteraceae bacterium]